MFCGNGSFINLILNKVIVQLNVFNLFMEHGVGCNMKSNLVITVQCSYLRMNYMKITKEKPNPSEFKYVVATVLYSILAEERDTTFYFLDFQEIKDWPKSTQYPVTDLQVSGYDAQSEPQLVVSCKLEEVENKIPCLGVDLMCFKTLCAAVKFFVVGLFMNWLRVCTR